MQDATGYFPLKIRSAIVPAVQFGSTLGPWLFIAGFLLGILELAWAGVILFALSTVFALVTLPVELDASNRAKSLLVSQNILQSEETEGVKKVLSAAAWTYVAGAVSSVGNLLYYIFLLAGSSGRRRTS
jgi:Zn-dependent membrane protease YugP